MTSDLNGCRRSSLPSTSTIPAAEHERDSTSDYDRQRTVDEALEKEEKEINIEISSTSPCSIPRVRNFTTVLF